MSRDFVAVSFFLILFAVGVATDEGEPPALEESGGNNDFPLNKTASREALSEVKSTSSSIRAQHLDRETAGGSARRFGRVFFLPTGIILGFIVLFVFFYNANRRWRMVHSRYVQQRNEALQEQFHDKKPFIHQTV